MAAKRALDEPTLDQLFAKPIVQQLMHRDTIDEATTRRLLATGGRRSIDATYRRGTCPCNGAIVAHRHPQCLQYHHTHAKTMPGMIGRSARVVRS
jgi:hypothetical protein